MYSQQLVHRITGKGIKNGVSRFYVRIITTLKSMIPTTLKYQNRVEPLSGNSKQGKSPVIGTKNRVPSDFPQTKILISREKFRL